jgi:hypothetical protein
VIDIRHWLLDAAVEFAIPVRILGALNVGEILNRKPHGLAKADLALCLEELIERGEIELCRHLKRRQPEVSTHLTNEEISRLLGEDRWAMSAPWSYRLTPLGGAEWEEWAKPQWSRYSRTCSWDNFGEIGAATKSVAHELFELEESILRECAIVPGSIRRRIFRNWQATYWKTLPEGHLIAFRTRPLKKEEGIPASNAKQSRWIELDKFYLRPADCGF